jgi:hypothetical protein
MKRLKKKRLRIKQANKSRMRKLIRRKKRFNSKVDELLKTFLRNNKNLTFSQAKQQAIKFILG